MRARGLQLLAAWLVLVLAFLALRRARGAAGEAPAPDGTAAPHTTVEVAESPRVPRPAPEPPELAGARAELVPTSGPGSDPFEVRVVAGPERTPVRGAQVLFGPWNYGSSDPVQELDPMWIPVESFLARRGEARTTDALGVAHLPSPVPGTWITGRLGDLYGATSPQVAEPGPLELWLEPDPPLEVLVVDALGLGVVNVPVGLRWTPEQGDRTRARTGANGRAVLRPSALGTRLASRKVFVGLAFPLREPVAEPVDLDAPPAEPVVLRMPPTASLEIEVVDARGRPWTRSVELGIALAPRILAELGQLESGANRFRVAFLEGRTRIEPLGLGLDLELDIETQAHDATRIVHGPRVPGERAQARVVLEPPSRILVGRLVSGSRPLGPGYVRIGDGRCRAASQVSVQGRFSIRDEWSPETVTDGLDFELHGADGSVWSTLRDMPELRSVADLPVEEDSLEIDLGDVLLTEVPPAVTGTVRDESGAPVRTARVQLDLEPDPARRDADPFGPEEVPVDALGRFEFRKHLDGPTLRLTTTAPGYLPGEPIRVPLGTRGLEVVLQRGGTVLCRLLFDASPMPDLTLERDGVSVRASVSRRITDGLVELGPVAPGSYALCCRERDSWLLAKVEGIVVRAGERTVDPRLDPLDVRGLEDRLALTVTDAEGLPVPGLVLRTWDPRWGFGQDFGRTDGERRIVHARPPLRVRLEAPGFRTLELDGVDSDRRIVLERGRVLHLELVGSLPALPEGWVLEGVLHETTPGEPGRTDAVPRLHFEGGVARTSFTRPGPYVLRYRISEHHAGKELTRATFWEDRPTPLVLEEGEGPQVLRAAAPSPELVDEILAFVAGNG